MLNNVQRVGGQEQCAAATLNASSQMTLEHHCASRIETVECLIEDNELWIPDQCQQHREFLARAQRQRIDEGFKIRQKSQLLAKRQEIITDVDNPLAAACTSRHWREVKRAGSASGAQP